MGANRPRATEDRLRGGPDCDQAVGPPPQIDSSAGIGMAAEA